MTRGPKSKKCKSNWGDPVWRAEHLKQIREKRGKLKQSDIHSATGDVSHESKKGKVPLPNYRADLDQKHGSTRRQIQISTDTEHRVESILADAKGVYTNDKSIMESSQLYRKLMCAPARSGRYNLGGRLDFEMEKLSYELRHQQRRLKASSAAKAMHSFREKLPAYKMKHQLLQAVANNQGFTFPVKEIFLEDVLEKTRHGVNINKLSRGRNKDPLTQLFEVEATIEYICRNEREGAVLVFLTGWDEISSLIEKLEGNPLLRNSKKFLLRPLHGSMPTLYQQEIFQRAPSGMRKIVIATNIAETSITIDDIVFVVEYQLPEILQTPLEGLCLQIKSLRFRDIAAFLSKALQPPEPLAVQNAVDLLKTIGALDEKEELTSLGCHLSTLPLDPKVGKMLLMVSPALTIAAALAHRDPFVLPIDKKKEADEAKRSFAGDSNSDHIALLRAFEGWQLAKRDGWERQFCHRNFLSPPTLQMMEDMRLQFYDLLADIGFIDKSSSQVYNRYSVDFEIVSAVLCAGLFPCVVQCKQQGKRMAFFTKEDGRVSLHPSSVNSNVQSFPRPYMVYSDKVRTTNIYIRDSTNISDYALLMFGGSLTPSQSGQGIEMLGGYLHFSASKRTLELVQNLREALDRLLQRKIDEPSLDIHTEGRGVVPAVVELLHCQNRQPNSHN